MKIHMKLPTTTEALFKVTVRAKWVTVGFVAYTYLSPLASSSTEGSSNYLQKPYLTWTCMPRKCRRIMQTLSSPRRSLGANKWRNHERGLGFLGAAVEEEVTGRGSTNFSSAKLLWDYEGSIIWIGPIRAETHQSARNWSGGRGSRSRPSTEEGKKVERKNRIPQSWAREEWWKERKVKESGRKVEWKYRIPQC